VDLRELEEDETPETTLREGRDFSTQAQWQTRRPARKRRSATVRPLLRALLADPGFTGQEPIALGEQPAWWAELALHYRAEARGGMR